MTLNLTETLNSRYVVRILITLLPSEYKFKYYPFVKNSSLDTGGGGKMYIERNVRYVG